MAGIPPASLFAAQSYVRFVSTRSLLEAVASSLTELFSPTIIAERVEGMLAGYDFIDQEALAYFRPRLTEAPQDSAFALAYCIENARTPAEQRPSSTLKFKCGVLWSMLDALHFAYVAPGLVPPGAFVPRDERAQPRAGRAPAPRQGAGARGAAGARAHRRAGRDGGGDPLRWWTDGAASRRSPRGSPPTTTPIPPRSRSMPRRSSPISRRGLCAAMTPAPPTGLLAELTHRCPPPAPIAPTRWSWCRRARTGHRDLGAGVPRGGRSRRAATPPLGRRARLAARS